MTGNVATFIDVLNRIAPVHLAEAWDNVGLQLGSRQWPVKKIWTALDPLPEVVAKAIENDVDLLVTHHPLFFKPINNIDCETPVGRIVQMASSSQLAVYSAHTNLDSAPGGVNDVLAERIGLHPLRVLAGPVKCERCKLVVFVPSTHVQAIVDALVDLNSGHMARYSCRSFRCSGVGTFLATDGSSPAVGKPGIFSEVEEQRVEVTVARKELDRVLGGLKKVHPYECMAYDVYALPAVDRQAGLGRVGELAAPVALADFVDNLKTTLNLGAVNVVGDLEEKVKTVAVCSGSGSSLLNAAIGSGAQVYVSGDLGYHTARDAQQKGIGLVDIGHFGSEQLIVGALAASIREASQALGLEVTVDAATIETDPFHHL